MYDAMMAETTGIRGADGDLVEAYTARPMDPGPHGGVLVIHHMPGYDRETKEIVRRFAVDGYGALPEPALPRRPRRGPGRRRRGRPRANGGVPDDRFVGDAAGAAALPAGEPTSNGRVARSASAPAAGRRSSRRSSWTLQAAIDCYGAFVTGDPAGGLPDPRRPDRAPARRPAGPLLGLFGNDDRNPSPDQVDELEKLLRRARQDHEFHRYDGAGHAFFSVDRPAYRVGGGARRLAADPHLPRRHLEG